MLKSLKLLRERVGGWDVYPFSVPAIRLFDELTFRSRACFFAGENGTGKSTLKLFKEDLPLFETKNRS
jgi:predicted ATPase